MKGKNRCKILKEIRRRIAEENDIIYVTSECKYKGDCLGTCPKCESEVRYLERELERRRSLGYKVTVAGLAAGITLSSVGCTPDTTSRVSSEQSSMDGFVVNSSEFSEVSDESSVPEYVTEVETVGELAPEVSVVEPLTGDLSIESEDISNYIEVGEIMGDIAVEDISQ